MCVNGACTTLNVIQFCKDSYAGIDTHLVYNVYCETYSNGCVTIRQAIYKVLAILSFKQGRNIYHRSLALGWMGEGQLGLHSFDSCILRKLPHTFV